jgi:hypothetical protein
MSATSLVVIYAFTSSRSGAAGAFVHDRVFSCCNVAKGCSIEVDGAISYAARRQASGV